MLLLDGFPGQANIVGPHDVRTPDHPQVDILVLPRDDRQTANVVDIHAPQRHVHRVIGA